MSKLSRLALIALTLALTLTNVVPVNAGTEPIVVEQSDDVVVRFQNQSGETVTIRLTGPISLTLQLKPKSNSANMPIGTYKFSYTACGKTTQGTLKVRANSNLLTIPKCQSKGQQDAGEKEVKVVIHNKTDGTLTFRFTGPGTYSFTLAPGKSKVMMLAGKYNYTVSGSACGSYGSQGGSVNIRNGLTWTWFCK
jgi:hypothetical protein